MRSILTLLFAILAVGSAWMFTARPAVQAPQCAAPAATQTPPLFMVLEDDELDNPKIAADDKIQPARKCGFCMG